MYTKTNLIINDRSYCEKYIEKTYFLYDRHGKTLAIANNNFGLYIAGIEEDINKWFLSLGITEVKR